MRRSGFVNTTPLRSNDAIVQDFYQYYRVFYKHIEAFGDFNAANNTDGMFKALSNLFDVVSCRFSRDESKELKEKMSSLRYRVLGLPKRAIVVQMQPALNKKRSDAIDEMSNIFQRIMELLNEQNMLVPTYIQDSRPKSVQ